MSYSLYAQISRRWQSGGNFYFVAMITRFIHIFVLALALFTAHAQAKVVEIMAVEFPDAMQPQVAAAPDGGIDLVFGQGDAIYFAHSPDGRVFSPQVKVAVAPKLALGLRRGPRVTHTGKVILVSAVSNVDGNLHAWTSSDGGQNWKEGAPINSIPKAAREGLHAMSGDGQSLVFAVWLDDRNGGKELWGRTSPDGGLTWKAETRIYASPDGHICECCHPSVSLSPKGEIAVMWRNWLGGSRDLWLATSHDAGATFGDFHKLGEGSWKLGGCPMDGGGVTYDSAGAPATVWRRETSVYQATALSGETLLAEHAAQPNIASSGPNTFLAWEQDGKIELKKNGEPAQPMGKGRFPALAPVGRTGHVFVAWEVKNGDSSAVVAEINP